MADLVFDTHFDVEYGRVDKVSPLVRRVVANNPGPFTFRGTGTYLVGTGDVAVIDPGPDDPAHLEALLLALDGHTVTHILVTHTHRDHSPAAAALQAATGARTYGFGPHPADDLGLGEPKDGEAAPNPEESHDFAFSPDVTTVDGDVIEGRGWRFEAVHTPGHISNHLCFALLDEHVLFSGDHVMGWSTSVVSPPGGDMAAYLHSLARLLPRPDATYLPTHGPAIRDPKPYVQGLIAHRRDREAAILQRLAAGDSRIPDIVKALYVGLDERLVKAAGRSVLAHLALLVDDGRVTCDGPPTGDSAFRLAPA